MGLLTEPCKTLKTYLLMIPILVDRFLVGHPQVVLCGENLFPLITCAYIVGCKFHEDNILFLSHFQPSLSFLPMDLLKEMERTFLRAIDYRVAVTENEWTEYEEIITSFESNI
eukprot:TRINITY_DN6409_c0_g2_i1.p1 TRINITY_DN6409_c0_g2~~TRINITY_DN6409_c0_g2_i1.p1  ORF type:complete len:113 (-),score=6.95 TRINITY_DN6409_c0_g2_i1:58-396(-)